MLKQLINIQQHRERRLRRKLTNLNRDANALLKEKERLRFIFQELNQQRALLSERCGLMTLSDINSIQEQLIRNDVDRSRIIIAIDGLSDKYKSIKGDIINTSQSIKDNLRKQEKMLLLESALTDDNNQ